ncbi:hypothetical protein TSUD_404950 [Trifolium subterraneum]|uniref:Zinc knuckle CX2CX4HX4C domain-containing protein n=1 Tax=Trifolium subterraneum TaxID=3900 RepID=A0A2Z6PPS8_TRISU|nr:hypothetical protein TSUD_404950 [Trifolium subterraneum]
MMDFDHVPVWIHIWGLPPHCKTKAMGNHLGSLMGEVEASEVYEYPGKQVIIKFKVAISVHKPILSGIHVGNPTDGTCWIDYMYEKLPQTCFNCGLVGQEAKLCKNQALNAYTTAPLGPWIRSSQYGRRKMEEKDRKFYSNPSHSPNFGKYSPPVPASLLAQLAAMKLQTQTPINNNQNQQQGEQNRKETSHRDTIQNTNQQLEVGIRTQHIEGNNQRSENAGKTNIKVAHQVKRLKLAYEPQADSRMLMDTNTMAGLGAQAGQQP